MNDEGKLFADKLGALIRKEGIGQVTAHERMMASAKELARIHHDAKYAKCMGIEFDTFKKRLQGKNVKRSARTMAEIAAYCFEPDEISADHLTDPSLPLADFQAKLGLYVGERGVDDASTVRQVYKVVFFIKARGTDGTPLLLNYFSSDWQMLLFPNVNTPQGDDVEAKLRMLLAERLAIPAASITLAYDPANDRLKSSTIKETADKEKIVKYGRFARYHFIYCPVKIDVPPEHLLQRRFTVRDVTWQWFSLAALKENNEIRHHNNDVLELLSREFDATLAFLEDSFGEAVGG